MHEMERNWTPEVAYRILRDAIDRCLDGRINPTQLQHWLLNTFATPPHTPPEHPVQNLFRLTVTDLAVYLHCDFERSDLEESLREAIQLVDDGHGGFTKMTRSPCFFAMMRNQQIPAPLINLTARNNRLIWEREGFREI